VPINLIGDFLVGDRKDRPARVAAKGALGVGATSFARAKSAGLLFSLFFHEIISGQRLLFRKKPRFPALSRMK
jgi:hypothetical protein